MGFTDYDKNMKFCMETGSNLDAVIEKLLV
jgi:hypothetical protein